MNIRDVTRPLVRAVSGASPIWKSWAAFLAHSILFFLYTAAAPDGGYLHGTVIPFPGQEIVL